MSAAVPTTHRPGGDDGHPAVPPVISDPTLHARRRRGGRARGWGAAATTTALWLYAAVPSVPLLLMLLNSLRTSRDRATQPRGLPRRPDFRSYRRAWIEASFSTYFMNSIIVPVASVVIATGVSRLAAYALA